MFRPLTALALLLGSTQAHAAPPWNGFQAAFPLLPCQDGWAGCLVNGAAVTPDLARDGTGAVAPSDLRVGWFDLHATASFSPFGTLSAYPAGGDDAVAAAEPEPAPEPTQEARQAEEASRASQEAEAAKAQADEQSRQAQADRAAAEEEAKRASAERAAAEAKAKAEAEAARKAREAAANASAAEKARLEAQAKAAEEARAKAEAEAKRKAEEQARLEADRKAKEEAAKAAAAAARAAAEEQAKKKLAEEAAAKAAQEAAAKAAQEAAAKKAQEEAMAKAGAGQGDGAAAVDPGAAAASADCSNTTDLEPMAMLGKLNEGQIACLNGRLQTDAKMTDKDKVSRVIMANAWAKGDKKGWEKQAKYHLEEIDQSDPDLCYKYALRLAAGGVARAPGVIRWADAALENRTVWTGDEYVSKVYGLYKMKAAAAQEMWKAAEAEHVAAPTDATKKKMEDARNLTKVYAREWYEYAKASGKDKVPPQQLCMSAAGTADYCEGG